MTQKEVEDIAWILSAITEIEPGGNGIYDSAKDIAGAALDAVDKIKRKYPRIAHEINEFIET